jgi:hypothetical protein
MTFASPWLGFGLFEAEQFDVKNKCGIWWDDRWEAAGAITEMRGHGQFALTAHFHRSYAFVPAFDDFAHAEGKLKGLAVIERTVSQPV